MTEHMLKVWPDFFDALANGSKPYEIRWNDRRFAVGDKLILCEWEPNTDQYTGRALCKTVTHVLHGMGNVGVIGPCRGISLGFVVLGLTDSKLYEVERDVACGAVRTQSGDDSGEASQLPLL
jgi:hypothetical protein